jgi:hypothetical protein
MDNTKYEYLVIVKTIEEQVFGKSGDRHSPYVLQVRRTESARCPGSRPSDCERHG